jgi:DNA-binding HxlR family transcriptional regulator
MDASMDNPVASCNHIVDMAERRRFDDQNCAVAQALEVLGDWWTLLVVREAFLGTRRFADCASNLAIARNILSRRLAHLVEHGVLARVDAGRHGPRFEYELTPKGKDLATVLTALRQWGDRWLYGPGHEPMLALDRRTGQPIPRIRIVDDDGQPIAGRDLSFVPGPGASRATRRRFDALARQKAEVSPPRPGPDRARRARS